LTVKSTTTRLFLSAPARRATRVPPQDVYFRADREHTHKLPLSLLRGVSPCPLPIRDLNVSNFPQVTVLFELLLSSPHNLFPLLLKRPPSALLPSHLILTLLIELINGETDTGEPRPGWMRVLENGSNSGPTALTLLVWRCRRCARYSIFRISAI
jgi:hypothetical protein